jgi:hypothetical protein
MLKMKTSATEENMGEFSCNLIQPKNKEKFPTYNSKSKN